jgi:ATP-binding cassette, subfamily B, bacterial
MKMRHALWKLITYRPGLYTADLVAWTVILLAELGGGYVAKLFFDAITDAAPAGLTVQSILALVVAVGIVRILTILVGALLDIRHRYTMGSLMRRNLLAQILEQPGALPLGRSTGEALNILRDDVQMVEDTMSWIIDQVAFGAYAAVALAILMAIDARVTMIVVLPLLTIIVAARLVSKHIRRFREASRRATERVTGAIGEAMESVETIQLAGAERHVLEHVRTLNAERLHATVRDRLLSQSFHSFFWNAATLCTGLILLAAADSLRAGTFTVGDFALFVIYVGILAEFVAIIGDFMMHLRQSSVSIDRMASLAPAGQQDAVLAHAPIHLTGDVPPVRSPGRRAGDRLQELRVDGLGFEWPSACPGDLQVAHGSGSQGLDDISFTVGRGEFVVITGRIGAGKSTLLRVLLGLLPMSRGTILWNGQPVDDPATFFVPPHSAYTPQVPQLFSDTLEANIRMGLPASPSMIEESLRAAVLEEDVPHLHQGLNTLVGARGVKLSGGQRQRTAAARMFLRSPELLVFDDLSSALDVETERCLWQRAFDAGNRTCLVVSHRRPALERADRIVLLKDGTVLGIGPLHQLLNEHQEMRALWHAP